MEDNLVWIIGLVALAVGALFGYLLGRTSDSSGKQQKLMDQLNEAQRELNEYKDQVNGHFEKTAELVNNLTESYKAVHNHLAQGSEALCMGEHAPVKLEANENTARLSDESETGVREEEIPTVTETTDESVVAPPLDYAPKKPDEEGTLSESYGLKKDQDEEDIPVLKDHVPSESQKDEQKQSA